LEKTTIPEVEVPKPTLPEIKLSTEMSVGPNGVLRDRQSTILMGNVPINSGAYAPQMRYVTTDEFYAMICPSCGASISPDGMTLSVYNSNGPAGTFSLLRKVTPEEIEFQKMLNSLQNDLQKRWVALTTNKQWNNQISGYEIITTDPSTLSDAYLNEVKERIQNGKATAQDKLYGFELNSRITKGIILPYYENPGTHDPSSPNFNNAKSVLPKDHEALFRKSIVGSDGNRWTKVGTGKKAVYHRFQDDGNGKWHWNGSTNSKKRDNTPNTIPEQKIPIDIKKSK
jgi:hypothetical protein